MLATRRFLADLRAPSPPATLSVGEGRKFDEQYFDYLAVRAVAMVFQSAECKNS